MANFITTKQVDGELFACCSNCGKVHTVGMTPGKLRRSTKGFIALLCSECRCVSLFDLGLGIGGAYVKVSIDHGRLNGWVGVRESTADEQNSIYNAMRVRDEVTE